MLKGKRISKLFAGLLSLGMCPVMIFALPEGEKVVAGRASFDQPTKNKMIITTSDKAIINYNSFDIKTTESVNFIQPNSQSCVLNRVKGGASTSILGSLKANGRLFLVNPHGIYFGPSASVNAGSLVASTLDINDDDFMDDRLHFTSQSKVKGKIVNEGKIQATGIEGAVVLIASHVQNTGLIGAQAGKIVLASAEAITLDFEGDGLISFVLDGKLHGALIEQAGTIDAVAGNVYIDARSAGKAIQATVNTDDMVSSTHIVKQNGVVRLSGGSKTKGRDIYIAANNVEISGAKVDARRDLNVTAYKDTVTIADSDAFPVEMRCGGDLTVQGHHVIIDAQGHPKSIIASGGDLHLISDQTIDADGRFSSGGDFKVMKVNRKAGNFRGTKDPIISASGAVTFGTYSGVSLKVESLAGITATGTIDITDPDTAVSTSDSDGTLLASAPTLILRANLDSLQGFGLPLPTSSGGASFDPGSGTDIVLNDHVTTAGGPIIIDGNLLLGSDIDLSSAGGDIQITGTTNSQTSNRHLGVYADTGNVQFNDAVGGTLELASLTVEGSSILQDSSVTTTGALSYTGAVSLRGDITTSNADITLDGSVLRDLTENIAVTSNNGNITFTGPIDDDAGTNGLLVDAGSGNVTFGDAIGQSSLLKDLTVTATLIKQQSTVAVAGDITYTGDVELGGNISSGGSDFQITGNVTRNVNDDVTVDTSSANGNIAISGTIDGDATGRNLTLLAGTGQVTLGGAVGGTQALDNLTITAQTIDQNAQVTTDSSVAYIGQLNLSSGIEVASGNVDITGSVVLDGSGTHTLTSTTGNITIDGTVDGSVSNRDLVLVASSGTVTLLNEVGGSQALGTLLVNASTIDQTHAVTTSGTVDYTGAVNLGGNVTTNNNNVTIDGNVLCNNSTDVTIFTGSGIGNIHITGFVDGLTTNHNLTLDAGTGNVVLDTVVGTNPLGAFTVNANLIDQNSSVTTDSHVSYTGSVQLGGNISSHNGNIDIIGNITRDTTDNVTLTSSLGNVQISGAIDGNVSGRSLALTAEQGTVTVNGIVGGSVALDNLETSALAIAQTGNVTLDNVAVYIGAVALEGNVTAGGAINVAGSLAVSQATTTLSAGDDININGTIDGDIAGRNLTITTTSGTVALGSDVGATNALGTLALSGDVVHNEGAITTNNGVTFTGSTELGGNVTVNNGNVLFNNDTSLQNISALVIDTSGGSGNVTFSGTVDGSFPGFDLTILAGSGIATFSDTVGTTQALNALSVSAGTIDQNSTVAVEGGLTYNGLSQVGGDIIATDSDITFNGDVILDTISSITLNASTNNLITFNGPVDGDTSGRSLTLVAGTGSVSFNDIVGGIEPLNVLTVTAAIIDQNAEITTTGNITFVGATNLGANITSNNNTILFDGDVVRDEIDDVTVLAGPGAGTIDITGSLNGDVPGRNLTLDAGTGSVTIIGPVGNLQPLNSLIIIP